LKGGIATQTDLDFASDVNQLVIADANYNAGFLISTFIPSGAGSTPSQAGGAATQPHLFLKEQGLVASEVSAFDLKLTADGVRLEILRFVNAAPVTVIYGLSLLSQSETL
jgi:hypothetical protein